MLLRDDFTHASLAFVDTFQGVSMQAIRKSFRAFTTLA